MRIGRFTEFLMERLAGSGHPGISAVDTYTIPDVTQPVVRCTDGSEIYLVVAGTAPPGGAGYSKPEEIVRREPGTEIAVKHRAD